MYESRTEIQCAFKSYPYIDLSKRRILLNAFFISQFSYCPLVWMFHGPGKNNSLRVIYNDKKSTFYELLEKYGSASIHKRNLRLLACEMFKLKRNMALELIMGLIRPNRQHWYELRNNPDFAVPIVKSVYKDLESLSYLGPKILELLPLEIKETETLLQFKAKIKKWNPPKLSLSSLENILAECWIHLG